MVEQARVHRIKDLDTLVGFLREDLSWDLPEASVDDVSFEWTGDDLNLSESVHTKLKDGVVRQLQPFSSRQPWGIFVIEFAVDYVSTITLRQILRCFVAKRRGARPDLPAWQCDNLLFICLYGENGFTFAHFKGDKPYSSRLTTFSWHPGEPIRTVCEFNLPALRYEDTWMPEAWVTEWQKAFDVEKVNKQFYRQISQFYYRLTGKEGHGRELVLPYVGDDLGSVSTYEEFAVRLIGRAIFCWFLKHKVSEGSRIPLIPPEALSLAAAQETDDFYHTVLEPLFFEVMNKPLQDRSPLSMPRADTIPFLNGGLFEPHHNDFYVGEANHGLKIPDTWFIDFFSLLERFNFTITENSSIDVDVAVDPEMLGRIFENLLAEVVPETGETARKATGSYYTPRAIVDYMVKQSLKQYLLTRTELSDEKTDRLLDYGESVEDFTPDEKLAAVTALREMKVIDPACGSGAFLMGILHRMLAVLEKVDPRLELWRAQYLRSLDGIVRQTVEKNISHENWAYIRKLMIIRDSIYGVDIQPIAVEIAKLRCFLSLVVDELVLDNEENRGIEPLPNLEFKFVAANTLIGLPEISDMGLMENKELIKHLDRLRQEYFAPRGDKERPKTEFRRVQAQLGEHYRKLLITTKTDFTGAVRKLEAKRATQTQLLAEWDPFSYASCGWFDPKWMFGVENGFNIVIANPPYIEFKKMSDSTKATHRSYSTATGKYDIYVLFIELAKRILDSEGSLCFINPTTFMKKDYGIGLRRLISQSLCVRCIQDFGDIQAFENATNYTGIFVLTNQLPTEYEFEYHKYKNIGRNITHSEFSESLSSAEEFKDIITVSSKVVSPDMWNFQPLQMNALLEKVGKNSRPLSVYVAEVFEGIASGKDEVFYITEDVIHEYNIEQGIVFPVLKGRDIRSYFIKWSGYYVLYPYDDSSRAYSEIEMQELFPNALAYLRSKRSLLAGRGYFERSNKRWFELWNQRKFKNFNQLRIVTPEISDRNRFAVTDSFFGNTKTYHIILKDNHQEKRYLAFLGLLNSRLLDCVYKLITTPHAGGFYAYKSQFLNLIPVVNKLDDHEDQIAYQVKVILNAKRSDPASDVRLQESSINRMVYEMYELTPEEIAMVERSSGT